MNRRVMVLRAGLVCLLAPSASAADVRVTPVRIVLTGAAPIASMHVENAGSEEILMQLRLVKWSQRDGQDGFEPTSDVIANPPGFQLKGGGDQIVRFGLETAVGKDEMTYRVFIDQVPRAEDAKANQVQTVLRISIPVFVPGTASEPRLVWSLIPGHPATLRATNGGNAHIEIDGAVVKNVQGDTLATIGRPAYILAGQTHDWPIGALVKTGERVTIQAQTDLQPVAVEVTVSPDAAGHP